MQTTEAELKALMLAALEGDQRAYGALLGDLRVRLAGYFGRRLRGDPAQSDDLVQETLIAIHAKRATFDTGLDLMPWVHAIARYKLFDHYRRRGRRAEAPLEDLAEETALAHLPPRARALLRGLKIDGLTSEEAGLRFGMSPGAVKVAAHRAMKALTERYAPGGPDGHE
jgi:RNA polymerase sigma-70 factor (ECF subfamily)